MLHGYVQVVQVVQVMQAVQAQAQVSSESRPREGAGWSLDGAVPAGCGDVA